MATRSKADPVTTTETNYKFDLDLPESEVRELMAGRVPQSVKDVIAPMVAWQDDETNPFYRAYGRTKNDDDLSRIPGHGVSEGTQHAKTATS